jgi:DmsE family decaheme c-type cytochrome
VPFKKYFLILFPLIVIMAICHVSTIVWSQDTEKKIQSEYMSNYTGVGADKTGSEACILCHEDRKPSKVRSHIVVIDTNPKNPNFGFSCEGCHGPGGNHNGDVAGIIQPDKLNIDEITSTCSSCHAKLRTYAKQSWLVSEHYFSEIGCLECHGGHSDKRNFLKEESELTLCLDCHIGNRAEFSMRSHHPVREELVECTSCHNPMSGDNDKQLVREGDHLCFECHRDKQGPFLFEMGIGTDNGGDGCLSCHFPHGSNADNLLRYPQNLCTGCHSDMRPPAHFAGKKCWECHVDIHGSNDDPLFF